MKLVGQLIDTAVLPTVGDGSYKPAIHLLNSKDILECFLKKLHERIAELDQGIVATTSAYLKRAWRRSSAWVMPRY